MSDRLALLLEQSQRLMTDRDPAALLQHVAAGAREITQAAIAAVGLVDDDGCFEDMVSIGLDDARVTEFKQQLATDSDHPARRVVETGEAVSGTNVHSFLFVPIASPSRVYGWLAVVEKMGAAEFSDVDMLLATTFGAQAGIVYENARLMSRLQAQADEIRKHEEQTDFAMTAARIGVSYRDLGSSWVVISQSLARLLGLPPGARGLSQVEIYERTHPDDRARVRATVEKAVRDLSDFTLAFRMILPEGVVRWFQFDGRVALDEQGAPARVVGVLADITDRRSLEMQLRQAQKMEAVGQLAGGVAHDFNNLLTAIIGYARFALERSREPEQRHDIDEIIKAAGRAGALTKQLLSFSRRHVMETVSIDVNHLIVDMVSMLRRMIGEDIELSTSLAGGLSAVRADRSQLEQVVMNLVVNARDATGSGGAIQIETGTVTLEATPPPPQSLKPGSYVTLTVSDNGCGMSEETKARLYEPFFTTKPRGQGTGLGLATVYGIVMQSGGSIAVESEPGQGAAFTVYLPADSGAAHVQERPPEPQRASGSATVLLVEDEQAVRELVRIILERSGYSVIEAANASEAETLFDAMGALDLLVTDVVMPGRSGFELFHRLHEKLPTLRVLFISGYTDYAMFDETIVERDLAFLEKPFSAEGLVAKVRDVLAGSR
jgi:two-component system, cell cycle sensor histidine kinase and response regulator CckA